MSCNRRILIIDDNENIHQDFRTILEARPEQDATLEMEEAAIFGAAAPKSTPFEGFELDSAYQGEEGVEKTRQAFQNNQPYAITFVDMRMPPGQDGVNTIQRLWGIDPDLQIVICTAYSDYSWDDIIATLGNTDKLLILKKPYDAIEVLQLAAALIEKRALLVKTRRWNEDLEQTVAERTRRLNLEIEQRKTTEKELEKALFLAEQANSQLQQETARANQLAEEALQATKAKGEFLANMSHEIRTPMNSIVGFGKLLQEEELNATQREYLNTICSASEMLLTIINDILDFSAIEARKLSLNCQECSLSEMVLRIRDMLRPIAAQKNLELEVVQGKGLPEIIQTDPIRLRQCLINLVNNALKFTSKGHVYIRMTPQETVGADWIRFDIEDTGIGINKEDLKRIFEPFSQADGSTSRKYGGTGLGLTITKKLIEMLGGSVSVTSELGKGSTFSLLMPARFVTAECTFQESDDFYMAKS